MSDAFTSGNWSVFNPRTRRASLNPKAPSDQRLMVVHPDGERVLAVCNIGYVGRHGEVSLAEREANATLMAAAPKLYRALVRLLDCPDVNEDTLSPETIAALDQARDAIRVAVEVDNVAL